MPFMVLDEGGNILSFNKDAGGLLSLKKNNQNIFDIFEDSSSEKFNQYFNNIYEKNKTVSEQVILTLKNGSEIKGLLVLTPYGEENELFIFFTFKEETAKASFNDIADFEINYGDYADFLSDENVIEIIEEVKSLYPFTFIGKEKIRKQVDALEKSFWIKDTTGNYILVNKYFAKSLGLKSSQLEGRSERTFLPQYLQNFFHSVEEYIKESLNCVILKGIPVKGQSIVKNERTVEIPLSDADNKVIAVIGVTENAETEASLDESFFLQMYDLLSQTLTQPFAVFDKEGVYRYGNINFENIFLEKYDKKINKSISDIFPLDISEKVKYFLNALSDEEITSFKSRINNGGNLPVSYTVYLNKIGGLKNQAVGFTILFDEIFSGDDLEKLINSRGRMFEVLIDNNPEPIFIYDTENLRFLEVNKAALSLYGYRKDEFLQMDLTDLYTPEDIQTLLDSSSAGEGETKFKGPYRHKKKDGSSVFVELSKIQFNYKDKDAHFNIIKDVTDLLDLEKRTQLFKAAFDNTNDLLFITDSSGFITFANKAVLENLGYVKSDLENSSFPSIVKDEERGTVNTSIFQSHLKDSVSLTVELKNKEGKLFEVELTATPILDYNQEIESFNLIGKLIKKEIPPKEVVKEVIKEVVVEKPVPAETISQTVKQKDDEFSSTDFFSSLFHELLTPINVILGFVQELTETAVEKTPEQREAVDIINQNRDVLLDIMNSAIEYSKMKEGETDVKIEEIGITQIIDQLQDDLVKTSSKKDAEFTYGKISSSLMFESDKHKIQNFVSHVIKIASHLTNEKKIYFSAYPRDDESFLLAVRDNYSSISPAMLDNFRIIFEEHDSSIGKQVGLSSLSIEFAESLLLTLKGKFEIIKNDNGTLDYNFIFPLHWPQDEVSEQLPSDQIPAEETIPLDNYDEEVKDEENVEPESEINEEIAEPETTVPEDEVDDEEIVENDNGEDFDEPEEYEVEREILPGSVEDEELEILDEADEAKEKPAVKFSNTLDLSHLNCLYIEDQVDSQILFKVQMKELRDIKFAVSFEEALPLLDSEHFDFIVMDINLQGEYNGLDALKIIHRMPGYENIPIIAVTAYVLPGDKEKFIASGFNDFISKPIFREKMIDSLHKIFSMQM